MDKLKTVPIQEYLPINTEEERKERIKEGIEWMRYRNENFPCEEWEIYCIIFFNTLAIGELSIAITYDELKDMILKNSPHPFGLLPDSLDGWIYKPADNIIITSLERIISKDLIRIGKGKYSINLFHELNILFEDKTIVHSRFWSENQGVFV